MKIVVTAEGRTLDAPASPIFGRAPVFVFVNLDDMSYEAVDNAAIAAGGGAGIQAAQLVVERGANAIISGNLGPNAFQVLAAAGVTAYNHVGGTVREVVEAFKRGELHPVAQANVAAHSGMGMAGRMGGAARPTTTAPADAATYAQEIQALTEQAARLRRELTEIMEKLERLQEGRKA